VPKLYCGLAGKDTTDQIVGIAEIPRSDLQGGGETCVFTKELDPRFDLRNHSPTGFAWGYGGSGPAQLALAILADAYGDDEIAQELYQDFKWAFIAHLPQDKDWMISETAVITLANRCRTANRNG
jgi:hypothetical protein